MFCQTLKPVLKPVAQMVQQGCASIVGEPTPTVFDFTNGISAAEVFDTYTRASTHVIADDSGNLIEVPANAVALTGLRPVRNLWPSADGSDTPSTQTITVVSGNVYQLRIGAESASGATAVCSGAFTGTLTGDGADIQTFTAGKTATSTSLTVTITGSVRKIQLEDITHRAAVSTAPSEYVSVGVESAPYHGYGIDGLAYKATALANTVDGSGIVTEATGAAITGELDYQPAATNLQQNSNDFTTRSTASSGAGSSAPVVTPNYADGPLGPSTATRVQLNRGTNAAGYSILIDLQTGGSASTNYTHAIYARATSGTANVSVYCSGDWFNSPGDNAHTVHALTEEWQLVSATGLTGSSGTQISPGFGLVGSNFASGCDETADILVSAQQFEVGTVPTAYIPTSGATASRAVTTAEYDVPAANTTAFTVTGLDASLDPDPSDDTEREVEETDWSGAIGDVFTGPVKIKSISYVDNT